MGELFDVSVDSIDPVAIVRLRGEVDLAGEERLADCLARLSGSVVIDLAEVTFLDSSGLGVLADADRRLGEAGGSMAVKNPSPTVRRVLEITGLEAWIEAPSECGITTP